MASPLSNQRIWLIGASTGIGAALAHELDAQGTTLVLSARRRGLLDDLNQQLAGNHHVVACDVADTDAVATAAQQAVACMGGIDRAIFLAAIYQPSPIRTMDMALVQQMFRVNVLGAMYCTYALLPIFDQQQSGQLALCASVAGLIGLGGGQPYSATKAALINFAESLRV